MKEVTREEFENLKAVHEIQNVFGRYEYYHVSNYQKESVELFVKSRDDIRVEIANLGVYEGRKSVERFFIGAGLNHTDVERVKGHLHLHTLTTPVIEVAMDGKTAQGVWISPGVETKPNGPAQWCWIRYGIDFLKEDGEWRIWHFHMYRIFTCEHDKSWLEDIYPATRTLPPEFAPDRPNENTWVFSKDVPCDPNPIPPRPYDTWDDSRAY